MKWVSHCRGPANSFLDQSGVNALKMTNISTAFAGAAIAAAAIVAGAPMALADADDSAVTTAALGGQGKLDGGTQVWTVTDLKPSTDTINYAPRGTLWEVTATNEALQGSVTPIVSNFNIRAADGQNYRALFQVPSTQGVNPATLAQGQKTSGKIYFDVTGEQPTSVVYNAGGNDVLVWNKTAAPAAAPAAAALRPGRHGPPPAPAPPRPRWAGRSAGTVRSTGHSRCRPRSWPLRQLHRAPVRSSRRPGRRQRKAQRRSQVHRPHRGTTARPPRYR